MTDPHARSAEGPDRLEQAIDRAVADLVQVDPAPGLRRRVASRLAAPPSSRWGRSAGYGLAGAALAALVLILAMPEWKQHPEPAGAGGAPSAASGLETAANDVPAERSHVAPPAVGQERDRSAPQGAGAQGSLSHPALVAPDDPGAPGAPAAPAVALRPRFDGTDDVGRLAAEAIAAAPRAEPRDPVSPPSLRRPSDGVETERGQAMVGAALASDPALSQLLTVPDAGATVGQGGDGRPTPRLEVKELAVPPLEVAPLHVAPIALTGRQP